MFSIYKLGCHIDMLICSCHPKLPCHVLAPLVAHTLQAVKMCWLLVLPLFFLVPLLTLNVVLPRVPAPPVAHTLYDIVHLLHLFFLVPLVHSCIVMPHVPAPPVAHALYAVEMC